MALVAKPLSVAELEERDEACEEVTSLRHFQAIYLLAKGHSTRDVAEITSFGQRLPSVLKPKLLERLRARLDEPPPTAGGGRAVRSPAGWLTNWGWKRSPRSVAGRR